MLLLLLLLLFVLFILLFFFVLILIFCAFLVGALIGTFFLVGGRNHPQQIRMIAGEAPLAAFTLATGVAIGARPSAQQTRCQGLSKIPLAAAGWAGKQQRMGQAPGPVQGPLPQGRLPGVNLPRNQKQASRIRASIC